MAKKESRLVKLVFDCYRELYRESTPSADFDELVANAPLNDKGVKMIDFNAYVIDSEKHDKIVDKYIKKGKLSFIAERGFRFEMALGSGPRIDIKHLTE